MPMQVVGDHTGEVGGGPDEGGCCQMSHQEAQILFCKHWDSTEGV